MRSVTGPPRDDRPDVATGTGRAAVSTWRVWVTDDDLRDARAAWDRARDGGAPPDRVLDLLEELERLTRARAYQAAGDPPAGGTAGTVPAQSLGGRRFLRPPRLPVAG